MNSEALHLCKAIMNPCAADVSKSTSHFDDGYSSKTIDASCFTVSNTKSSAVQTATSNRSRNKVASTDIQVAPKIETRVVETKAHVCDIHAIITLNVVAGKPEECTTLASAESNVKTLNAPLKKKECKRRNKCTCTVENCAQKKGCVESCKYPCQYGGIGPCNAFSLGTADYRMLLREKCNTMLIGGCRVPVCRNFKNKF